MAYLFALLFFLSGSSIVYAHAVVMDSTPKDKEVLNHPPREIVLHFNAKIEKPLARFSLTTDTNQAIPLAAPTKEYEGEKTSNRLVIPLPRLKPGNYLLRYTVFSTDGHSTPGILHFTITNKP